MSDFRTGKPPQWRVAIYALLAMALAVSLSYSNVRELNWHLKLLYWSCVMLIGLYIFFIGVGLPWFANRYKDWIIKNIRLLYLLLAIVAVLVGILYLSE